MPQLIVRKLEEAVVNRLREEAAKYGISVEEAHRRILRKALLGSPDATEFKDLLLSIPKGDEDEHLFERQHDQPRDPEL